MFSLVNDSLLIVLIMSFSNKVKSLKLVKNAIKEKSSCFRSCLIIFFKVSKLVWFRMFWLEASISLNIFLKVFIYYFFSTIFKD